MSCYVITLGHALILLTRPLFPISV